MLLHLLLVFSPLILGLSLLSEKRVLLLEQQTEGRDCKTDFEAQKSNTETSTTSSKKMPFKMMTVQVIKLLYLHSKRFNVDCFLLLMSGI